MLRLLQGRGPRGAAGLGATAVFAIPLFTANLHTRLFANILILGVLSMSLYITWTLGGVLSLGQAAFFGLGAYSAAISTVRLDGALWGVGLPLAAIAVSAVLAILIWAVAATTKLSEFTFAMITLIVVVLAQVLVNSSGPFGGGTSGIAGIPSLSIFGMRGAQVAYVLALAVSVVAILVVRTLERSALGVVLTAMSGNETRARVCGYRVDVYKGVAFAVGAMLATFAGYLYARQNGLVTPSLVGFDMSAAVIIWLVIGGRWSLFGPFLGVFLVRMFQFLLAEAAPETYAAITAVAFIAMIWFFPGGAAAGLRRAWDAVSTRTKPKVKAAVS